MIQKIIRSNSILLVPLRAVFFPYFYSYIRGVVVVFKSHPRLKLSLLKDLDKNEQEIKQVYIWKGFSYAINYSLGIEEIDHEY